MGWFEAVILGLVQGLTEFLPVSSSGHLEIGKVLLGVETSDDLLFTTMVHAATVLSTLVVFRKQIWDLLGGFFGGLKTIGVEKGKDGKYVLRSLTTLITGFRAWRRNWICLTPGNLQSWLTKPGQIAESLLRLIPTH